MKRYCQYILLLFMPVVACDLTKPEIPDTPFISFESVTYNTTADNRELMVVTISFEDGDGDLGLAGNERSEIYREFFEWRYLNGSNIGRPVFIREKGQYLYDPINWEIIKNLDGSIDTLEVANRGLEFVMITDPATGEKKRQEFDETVDTFDEFNWEKVEDKIYKVKRPVIELIRIGCSGPGIETQSENVEFKKEGDIDNGDYAIPKNVNDRDSAKPNERTARVCFNTENFYNIFITLLIKDTDGSFIPFWKTRTSKKSQVNAAKGLFSRFPLLNPENVDKPMKGTLTQNITESISENAIVKNGDLKIQIYIKDRALHKSNTVESNVFKLNQ